MARARRGGLLHSPGGGAASTRVALLLVPQSDSRRAYACSVVDDVEYPFRPKSNPHLRAGQFWAVPLSNGRFACGRVMDPTSRIAPRVMFIAGLMDWVGDAAPTEQDLVGRRVLAQGQAHIKTITETGGQVLAAGRLMPTISASITMTTACRHGAFNTSSGYRTSPRLTTGRSIAFACSGGRGGWPAPLLVPQAASGRRGKPTRPAGV